MLFGGGASYSSKSESPRWVGKRLLGLLSVVPVAVAVDAKLFFQAAVETHSLPAVVEDRRTRRAVTAAGTFTETVLAPSHRLMDDPFVFASHQISDFDI
jgi:hypothetical protein